MPLLFLFPLTHYTFLPSSLITTPSPNQTTSPSLLQHHSYNICNLVIPLAHINPLTFSQTFIALPFSN
ncbi:hypothetical protein AAZX31_13G128900 [Glycine max]